MISFAEYAAAPFYPGCAAPEPLKKCLAITALLFITIVNGLSVKAAQKMMIFFTIVKLALVAALIIGGFIMIGQGETQNFENAFDGTATSPSAWAIAIYNGSYTRFDRTGFFSLRNVELRCLESAEFCFTRIGESNT